MLQGLPYVLGQQIYPDIQYSAGVLHCSHTQMKTILRNYHIFQKCLFNHIFYKFWLTFFILNAIDIQKLNFALKKLITVLAILMKISWVFSVAPSWEPWCLISAEILMDEKQQQTADFQLSNCLLLFLLCGQSRSAVSAAEPESISEWEPWWCWWKSADFSVAPPAENNDVSALLRSWWMTSTIKRRVIIFWYHQEHHAIKIHTYWKDNIGFKQES